ncbi:MAG: hypothetical protein V3S05_02250 [Desulfobacterales bacterium]
MLRSIICLAPNFFVIVQAVIDHETYWLDPTRTYQRGTLENIYQPDYGLALVLSDQTMDLTPITPKKVTSPTRSVSERFDLRDGLEAPVRYTVTTTYTNYNADYFRNQLASQSKADLQKSYLNYYANYYPTIQTDSEFKIEDDEVKNKITVTEYYSIPSIWARHGVRP